MVCCLRSDPAKYSQCAIALINILGQNVNASLFAYAGQLVCYAYWSLLVKYVPQSLQNFSIDFDFPNIDEKLVN